MRQAWTGLACALAGALLGFAVTSPAGARLAVPLTLGVLLLAAAGRRPDVVILGLVVARPIVDCFVQITVLGLSLGQLWGVALVVSCALYLLLPNRDTGEVKPAVALAPVVLLLAYPLLTGAHGALALVLSGTLKLAAWILLALVIERVCATPQGQARTLRAALFTALSVAAAIGIVMAQNRYGSTYYDPAVRLVGPEQGPHQFAILAVLAIFFMLATALTRKAVLVPALLAAILGAELVLSFVRSAYLGALPILIAFFFLALGRMRMRASAIILILAAAASAAVLFSEGTIARRLQNLPFFGSGDTPVASLGSGRVAVWDATLSSALSSWTNAVFGQGAAASRDVVRQAIGASVWSHNDFIEVLLAGGIVLACVYVAVMAWLFVSTWRLATDSRQSRAVRRWGILAVSCVIGYVLMSLTNGVVFYQASVLMAVLVGLCRGMYLTPGDTAIDRDAGHSG